MKPQYTQPTDADRAWVKSARAKMALDHNYVVSKKFVAESHEIITRIGWPALTGLANELAEEQQCTEG